MSYNDNVPEHDLSGRVSERAPRMGAMKQHVPSLMSTRSNDAGQRMATQQIRSLNQSQPEINYPQSSAAGYPLASIGSLNPSLLHPEDVAQNTQPHHHSGAKREQFYYPAGPTEVQHGVHNLADVSSDVHMPDVGPLLSRVHGQGSGRGRGFSQLGPPSSYPWPSPNQDSSVPDHARPHNETSLPYGGSAPGPYLPSPAMFFIGAPSQSHRNPQAIIPRATAPPRNLVPESERFLCEMCETTFSRKDTRSRHMRTKHNMYWHEECTRCGVTNVRKDKRPKLCQPPSGEPSSAHEWVKIDHSESY